MSPIENGDFPLITIDLNCDDALRWVDAQLSSAGLQILRSFDLQAVRNESTLFACPIHPNEDCTCRMVVLLVYAANNAPITLVARAYDKMTRVSIVDTPAQRVDPEIGLAILQALAA